MNYRFLKFTTIYDQVKERLLARLPNHEQLSYRELYDQSRRFVLRGVITSPNICANLVTKPRISLRTSSRCRRRGRAKAASNFAARLVQSGSPVAVMRHAFAPSIIEDVGAIANRDLNFTFTGQLVLQSAYHQQRRELIMTLLKHTPPEIWIQISEPPSTVARLTRRAS